MKVVGALFASIACAWAGGAVAEPASVPVLPRPVFSANDTMLALAGAGPYVAVASGCDIRVANLLRNARPARVPRFGPCASGEIAEVDDLHLGRATLVAEQIESPSPHGDDYTLWAGPLPRGPLRAFAGEEWGWRDDSDPSAYGCAASVVAGGGLVTVTEVPNSLGVDGVVRCAGVAPTKIRLLGAARTITTLTMPGSWLVLATDGRRLVLERLAADGSGTADVEAVALDGTKVATPRFGAGAVATASRAWLVGQTLVLETPKGISGPGWTIRGAEDGTIGEGRLLYRKGHLVRVRRLRDGADRALVRLPTANALLAAGSFGLAVSTGIGGRTRVYRLPWRTIDRTLRR